MSAAAPLAEGELLVTVRGWGGTYIARMKNFRGVATCTTSAACAARRVAGKRLRVVEERIAVREIPCRLSHRYAFAAKLAEQGGAS